MDKSIIKKYEELTRDFVGHVCATDEQLEYLIKQYSDTDCVLGIHNTDVGYENIFEVGLRNQTGMHHDATDIANTVYYSKILCSLAMYPNGDGKERGKTAIILKIPKKVFSHEQGIFETLPDGVYGIPTQFIVGAFSDGVVINNPNYQKDYNNPDAIKCDDPDYNNNDTDKPIQIKIFRKEYKRHKNISVAKRIKNLIERIKGKNKQEMLPPAEVDSRDEAQAYRDSLRTEYVTSEETIKNQPANQVKQISKDGDDIQDR